MVPELFTHVNDVITQWFSLSPTRVRCEHSLVGTTDSYGFLITHYKGAAIDNWITRLRTKTPEVRSPDPPVTSVVYGNPL